VRALCPFSNFVVRKRTAQLERLDFARITGSYSGPEVGFEDTWRKAGQAQRDTAGAISSKPVSGWPTNHPERPRPLFVLNERIALILPTQNGKS
jgi:hypothetical protein